MAKKIVITGGTGFVGGALAQRLAESGHDVRVLARPNADRSRLAAYPVSWFEGDLLKPESLQGLLAGAEWVVHAAGMLGQAGIPEAAYHQIHAEGTRHLLTAVTQQAPQARVLHVSSPGVLGPITGPPADETTPFAPSNAYERSKAAGESIARIFASEGLDIVIARPEFVYGPGDLHVLGLFQAVKRGIFFYINGGRSLCHPTYIADAVKGMAACLENGRSGEIYHVMGETAVSFRELAETMAEVMQVRKPWLSIPKPAAWAGAVALELLGAVTGKTPPLSRSGVAFFSEDRYFSWAKAQQELGYVPDYSLKAGMAETVKWYEEQGLL
jgi:dihydroflavonol-4-reductase